MPGGDRGPVRRRPPPGRARRRAVGPTPQEPAAEDGEGHAHDLEVLVHVELDRAGHDEVGDEEERDGPGRQERPGGRARGDEREQPEQERQAQVRAVEEEDRAQALLEGRLLPAGDELDRRRARAAGAPAPGRRAAPARSGRGRARHRGASPAAATRAAPPRTARRAGRSPGRSRSGRARGGRPGLPASPIPARVPAERDAHEQEHREEPREPERRGPVREEPGPQDRGDPELRAARLPRVVVGESLDELPRGADARPARRGPAGSSPSRRP